MFSTRTLLQLESAAALRWGLSSCCSAVLSPSLSRALLPAAVLVLGDRYLLPALDELLQTVVTVCASAAAAD